MLFNDETIAFNTTAMMLIIFGIYKPVMKVILTGFCNLKID
jgi:hypothetical protein